MAAASAKVFGQRKNLLSPRFWRFILQINRFNAHRLAAMDDPRYEGMTLGDFAREVRLRAGLSTLYILPMAAPCGPHHRRRCSTSSTNADASLVQPRLSPCTRGGSGGPCAMARGSMCGSSFHPSRTKTGSTAPSPASSVAMVARSCSRENGAGGGL